MEKGRRKRHGIKEIIQERKKKERMNERKRGEDKE
jgi:hypothetical protein